MPTRPLIAELVIVLMLTAATTVLAVSLDLPWHTIDGGGEIRSTGGGFEVSGTIGQPDAGVVMTGGQFELIGGFWAGVSPSMDVPGDCDADGDIDLEDYACFEPCLQGPGAALLAGCGSFDLDADNDVDLQDFAAFGLTCTCH